MNSKKLVSLAPIFSENMVIQRDKKICFFGSGPKSKKILVEFNNIKKKVKIDNNEKWITYFPKLNAGGPYNFFIKINKKKIILKNVLVGDVWLCSGQSNMCMRLKKQCKYSNNDILKFNDKVRIINFSLKNSIARWEKINHKNCLDMPAIPYFFSKRIYNKIKVPIGIVHNAICNSSIERWISLKSLRKIRTLKKIIKKKDLFSISGCSFLYNKLIKPIVPFAIRGILWYQGEANVKLAYEYKKLFPLLIKDWRYSFKQKNLPFIYIQLPNYSYHNLKPVESSLAELRQSQFKAQKIKKTKMVTTIDTVNSYPAEYHPKDKKQVADRAVLAALNLVYNKKVISNGPTYKSKKVIGNKIYLYFSYIGKGLKIKGKKVKGFTIAGKDRKFYLANTIVKDKYVIVWNKKIKKPIAVRYAWSNNPICNLYNKNDLPAPTFSTDNWYTKTRNNTLEKELLKQSK